jgi:hypothetical protein
MTAVSVAASMGIRAVDASTNRIRVKLMMSPCVRRLTATMLPLRTSSSVNVNVYAASMYIHLLDYLVVICSVTITTMFSIGLYKENFIFFCLKLILKRAEIFFSKAFVYGNIF